MDGVFIADLKLLPAKGSIDVERVLARQGDLVRDLYCLVPRLASLCFGELRTSWIVATDACWLRLQLVPRQRILFDPLAPGRTRPRSLPDEARLLWEEICNSKLRALQAARGLEKWASNTDTPADPLHEMAFRRAKTQWTFESEAGQASVVFPEVPRYLVDDAPSEVSGIVDSVLPRAVVLRHVTARLVGESTPSIALRGSLRVVPCHDRVVVKRATPWPLVLKVWPGKPLSMPVTLHRCLLSRRVIGAVAHEVLKNS